MDCCSNNNNIAAWSRNGGSDYCEFESVKKKKKKNQTSKGHLRNSLEFIIRKEIQDGFKIDLYG